MSSLVVEAIQAEIGAAEPWPNNACIYQPYQVEQITFPDYANCLSVKTLLKMNGLPFKVALRINAEEMSPSGKVPFIHVGQFLVSELEPIIAFLNTRGFQLSRDLCDTRRSELRAYMSLVEGVLVNAELHLAWVNSKVSNEITKPRYGCVHPWPLSWLLPCRKQSEIIARLKSNGWYAKSLDEVRTEIQVACQALSERLDDQNFFFGCKPTELDALVFGHLYTLLTTNLPVSLASVIQEFPNLVRFCSNIDKKYFVDEDQHI